MASLGSQRRCWTCLDAVGNSTRAYPLWEAFAACRLVDIDDLATLSSALEFSWIPSDRLVVTTDTLVAGVHFPEFTSAHAVGHKALAVNLSDLAAIGASPVATSLQLTLPPNTTLAWSEFASGFSSLARRHAVSLLNVQVEQGPYAIHVQAFGRLKPGVPALTRRGACVGDAIYVTGTLGDAALALNLLLTTALTMKEIVGRQRLDYPEPRVMFGGAVSAFASACIDVSDGLLADLGHICAQSGVGAELDLAQLPLSSELGAAVPLFKAWDYALTGGDDYELCFTVPASRVTEFESKKKEFDVAVTRIGVVVAGSGIQLKGPPKYCRPTRTGYEHFQS